MTLFHAALIPDRTRVAERAMHGAVAHERSPPREHSHRQQLVHAIYPAVQVTALISPAQCRSHCMYFERVWR